MTAATLTDFLLARIAEDEEAANAATQGTPSGDGYGPWRESYDDCPTVTVFGYPSDRIVVRTDEYADQDHIIRWQPARVLAECEAKRRIVEWASLDLGEGHAKQLARYLALPYADHPDYRQEWKP